MNIDLDEVESGPVRRPARRGFLWLVIGIVVGVAGTLLLPRYVAPYLPEVLRGGGEQVDGVVLDIRRDDDNLLVTVDTERGAVLVTFTRRVPEVELLVGAGDTLTLGLTTYDPFVSDPTIAAVRKSRSAPGAGKAADSSGEARSDRIGPRAGAGDSAGGLASPASGDAASRVEAAVEPAAAAADSAPEGAAPEDAAQAAGDTGASAD